MRNLARPGQADLSMNLSTSDLVNAVRRRNALTVGDIGNLQGPQLGRSSATMKSTTPLVTPEQFGEFAAAPRRRQRDPLRDVSGSARASTASLAGQPDDRPPAWR